MRNSPAVGENVSRRNRPVAVSRRCSSDEIAEITVFGDIDLATAPALEVELRAVLLPPLPNRVLVNLGEVPFMGVAGLQVLASAHDLAKANGIPFRVYGVSREVHRSFVLSRLTHVLDLYPDRRAAVADLGGSV
jgi:anti-sigma B factor antagonist